METFQPPQERCVRFVVGRHGESSVNAARYTGGELDIIQGSLGTDIDNLLTESGEVQADLTGKMLRERHYYPVAAFASKSPRALRTCQIELDVLGRADLTIHQLPTLNELYRGSQELQHRRDVPHQKADSLDFQHVPDGPNPSEKLGDAGKRALAALAMIGHVVADIEKNVPEGEQPVVLAVAHAGTILYTLCEMFGLTLQQGEEQYGFLGNSEAVVVDFYLDRPAGDAERPRWELVDLIKHPVLT